MKQYTLIIIYIISFITIMNSVYSVDVWDRPIIPFNYSQLNLTINISLSNYYTKLETDNLLNNKLNTSDQRYNDTILINQLNNSLQSEILGRINNDTYIISLINNLTDDDSMFALNSSLQYEINGRIGNDTLLYSLINIINSSIYSINNSLYNTLTAINDTIKQPSGEYLSYNITNFYINESKLNQSINNISKINKYIYMMNINVINGSGFNITSFPINYLITEIKIIPFNNVTKYNSEVYESNFNIIDKNRMKHTGTWDIEKNYAINNNVIINITNSQNDGLYNGEIIYLRNGVE